MENKNSNYKLKDGEKYLTIDLSELTIKELVSGKVAAFSNDEQRQKNQNAPHFKSKHVSVWVNVYKQPTTKEEII